MKALVTGGAGFIGSSVVDAYLEQGLAVVVVDDLSRGAIENLNPRAKLYQIDIRDAAALEHLFETERPEIVNHHAAQMDVRRAVHEPVYDAEVNVIGSIHLLNCAVRFGVRRFIYASTAGAAYGEPASNPVAESHPINPITPYGISKHTVEHYLFAYLALYGLSYVVLRYGNVYGPRQSSRGEAGVVAIFCEQVLQGTRPKIYGDGSKTRDYVYVSDVARANLLALERGDREIFNIGCGLPTTDYEIFLKVRFALGSNTIEPTHVDKRPGEIDHVFLDVSKAREILGWAAKVPLDQGIPWSAAYFRQRLAERLVGPGPQAPRSMSAGGRRGSR